MARYANDLESNLHKLENENDVRTFVESSARFCQFFRSEGNKGEKLTVDVLNVFARFAIDGISMSVLGFEADCVRNEESDVFKMAKKILHDFAQAKKFMIFSITLLLMQ
jgi:hypothetical protein